MDRPFRPSAAGYAARRFRLASSRSKAVCRFIHSRGEVPAPDDPRRPPDYRPLDAFWQRRGFRKQPELTTAHAWKELGEDTASLKPMTFWRKELG